MKQQVPRLTCVLTVQKAFNERFVKTTVAQTECKNIEDAVENAENVSTSHI